MRELRSGEPVPAPKTVGPARGVVGQGIEDHQLDLPALDRILQPVEPVLVEGEGRIYHEHALSFTLNSLRIITLSVFSLVITWRRRFLVVAHAPIFFVILTSS